MALNTEKYYCIVWIKNTRYYLRRTTHDLKALDISHIDYFLTLDLTIAYKFTKGEQITQRRYLNSYKKRKQIDDYKFISLTQHLKYEHYFK